MKNSLKLFLPFNHSWLSSYSRKIFLSISVVYCFYPAIAEKRTNLSDTLNTIEFVVKKGVSAEICHVLASNPDIRQGPIEYRVNEKLMMSGSYDNNQMDGEWKFYYASGKLHNRLEFRKGKIVREWEAYDSLGLLKRNLSIEGAKEITRTYDSGHRCILEKIDSTGKWVRSIYYFAESGRVRAVSLPWNGDSSQVELREYYQNARLRSVLFEKSGKPFKLGGSFDQKGNATDQGTLNAGTGLLKIYQDTLPLILESEVNYTDGKPDGMMIYYDANGQIAQKGVFKAGRKTGKWLYYDKDRKLYEKDYEGRNTRYSEIETRVLPAFTHYLSWYYLTLNEDNKPFSFANSNSDPGFPGGFSALKQFLKANIRIPPTKPGEEIYGTIYIDFAVGMDGLLKTAKVSKGVRGGERLEREAMRVVSLMPRWMPGYFNEKPVEVHFNLPIAFR